MMSGPMRAVSNIFGDGNVCRAILSDIFDVNIQTIQNDDKKTPDGSWNWVQRRGVCACFLQSPILGSGQVWDVSKCHRLNYISDIYHGSVVCDLGVVFMGSVVIRRLTDYIWVAKTSDPMTKVAKKIIDKSRTTHSENVQPPVNLPAAFSTLFSLNYYLPLRR